MPPAPTGNSKKKNPGGKGMRRAAKGGNKREKKNKSFCQDFVDDIVAGEDVDPLTVARVERLCGSGQMQLLTVTGQTLTAALKGNLRCNKGAARSDDNTIAAFAGTTFVILQMEEYTNTIVGILSRTHVSTISPHFKNAPKGYFDASQTSEEDGFEWDLSGEGDEPAKTEVPVPDDDVDLDKL